MVLATKITFQLDSGLPRDGVTITPHYNGDDPQALVDRLKTNLVASTLIGATTPFTIKAYDAEKAPPSYPLAEAISGSGSKATTVPREAALCLSYYSTWNRPLYRGRLYIPAAFLLGPLALRPSDTQMANAASFAGILSNGLPQGTNWVVWSRKMAQANGVDHYWVDDEWDTVRSRGLKSTKRDEYTLP